MKKYQNLKKIIKNTFFYIFIIIATITVIFTIINKNKNNEASNIFGYQLRLVTTDSMAKCDLTDVSNYKIKSLPKNCLIFIKTIKEEEKNKFYSNLKVGDVLTFKYVYTEQVTITHRISSINKKDDGGYIITLIGDNKTTESNLLEQTIDTSNVSSPNYIIGEVKGKSLILGLLATIMKSSYSLIFIIIIPCVIFIIIEILKIFKVLNTEKEESKKQEIEKKDLELQELRNKIKELENNIVSN